jgi:hypothetical protein
VGALSVSRPRARRRTSSRRRIARLMPARSGAWPSAATVRSGHVDRCLEPTQREAELPVFRARAAERGDFNLGTTLVSGFVKSRSRRRQRLEKPR